jgi:hypothetical protein
VREVDQLEDPVHERVAEGDERVDRPVRQPDEHHVEELARVVDEVDPEPEHDQDDEPEPQPADDGPRHEGAKP